MSSDQKSAEDENLPSPEDLRQNLVNYHLRMREYYLQQVYATEQFLIALGESVNETRPSRRYRR